MAKSAEHHVETQQEFAKLEQVLNQTAEDTSSCLKLLKKNLSAYDSRNGNHFHHTAASYMRSDMRTAKDTAMDLKHVAHEISKSHKPSKTEVSSARNMMDATAKAMGNLEITARNYDKENGQSMGIKGRMDAAFGGDKEKHKHEHEQHGLLGKSAQEKEENRGGLFGKSDKEKESEGGLFGKNKDQDEKTGLFGKSQTEEEEHHRGGMLGGDDKNGGGIVGSTETVETFVKKTLRDNFSLRALDQQITAAEKSLSPSVMERAKDAMHGVKEKLTGDKTASPTNAGHHQTAHTAHP
jgi:hypothetical protein